MKKLSSKAHPYTAAIIILLIVLAIVTLMAGMAGCGRGPYDLLIHSPAGGSLTTLSNETPPYPNGTVVNLTATPDAGCRFLNWTGDVSTIGNVTAAATNIIADTLVARQELIDRAPGSVRDFVQGWFTGIDMM